MIVFQVWKEIIEEISESYKIEMWEIFYNITGGIVLTILFLPCGIVLSPFELITLIVYKILKRRHR